MMDLDLARIAFQFIGWSIFAFSISRLLSDAAMLTIFPRWKALKWRIYDRTFASIGAENGDSSILGNVMD